MSNRTTMLMLLVIGLSFSCGPNQRILESANNTDTPTNQSIVSNPAETPNVPTFEQDLNAMRTADFKFILSFRRKDGQVMDAADKELISKNTAGQANRRRLSDDGRAIIIGGNFQFAKVHMDELTARFQMENFSKPDSGPFIMNVTPIN